MTNEQEMNRMLDEIRAERAADYRFAVEHQTGLVEHKSGHTGKITMKQWSFHRGNRKCLLTRFPGERTWAVSLWEGKHLDGTDGFSTKDQALYSVAEWLRGARMDS